VETSSGKFIRLKAEDMQTMVLNLCPQEHLRKEGVRHELTAVKNPEQNGVTERMNRIFIESVR
jgi:hypothetical protein